MNKIKIKNFGPIKDGFLENEGWFDIKKVTVLIGNQGSGKSTIAKAYSTLSWIEKALTRGDLTLARLRDVKPSNKNNNPWKYHRLENYFSSDKNTWIEYEGDSYNISFKENVWEIKEKNTDIYHLPQIMYVPAERNFISYALRSIPNVSESLTDFLTEYNRAKNDLKGPLVLPINNESIIYERNFDRVSIVGDNYKLQIGEASSGFQSLVPLFLVTKYLSESINDEFKTQSNKMRIEQRERFTKEINFILENNNLTQEQKNIAISELSKKFNKTVLINIVEEPEQNLFPSSQQKILNCLLKFNNLNNGNKLVMTTHSPYLINYLTIAVKGNILKQNNLSKEQKLKLQNIIPLDSTVAPEDLVIYQLDEKLGTIKKLEPINDLPSDENELNERLGEGNELFAKLLEIQQNI